MKLKVYNGPEDDFENYELSEVIKQIEDFGDGPLEFETSVISAMAMKLQSQSKDIERRDKILKEYRTINSIGKYSNQEDELGYKTQVLDILLSTLNKEKG